MPVKMLRGADISGRSEAVHWKKPIATVTGIFLLAGLLLFVAGELSADTLKGDPGPLPLSIGTGDVPDTLSGGGSQNPDEDSSGDPDDVDFTIPLTLWFFGLLLNL